MDKNEVLQLTKEHKDSFVQIIKSNDYSFYVDVNEKFQGKSFSEKLYRWYKNEDDNSLGKCFLCKSDTKFLTFGEGYRPYCSAKCANIINRGKFAEERKLNPPEKDLKYWVEKKCEVCSNLFWSLIKRDGKFCSNICSSNYTANSIERLNKIRETKLERYGDETYVNPEKARQTCLEKYGVDNASKSQQVIEKINRIRKNMFYEKNLTNHKLTEKTIPLFTKEEYVNTDKQNKYKFQCKKCNGIFEDHIDGGHLPRCLKCYPHLYAYSYDEKDVVDFVRKEVGSINVIENDRSILGKNREIDIYIPEKNLAIEYDGLYWHSEVGGNKSNQYHLEKYRICLEKGIRLIQIFEDEWLYKNDIVKNRLKYILGGSTEKIFARSCNVKEITSQESEVFLEKYHLQGNLPSKYKIGLFYDNTLISVMTFSLPRICLGQENINDGSYELLRMVSSCNVIGGASKMFSYFIKEHAPSYIVTYSDLRWNTGEVYRKMGMTYIKNSLPSYWYLKLGGDVRYHRFGFRKNILKDKLDIFDPELTEWENMQLNGYDRIWDCGNAKYEWRRK